ncbi:MAG: hypothetical protein K2Q01_07465, partial [Rickettsiales bacterium]|nr:hypothetical protein [Rickettsiales bacterium]
RPYVMDKDWPAFLFPWDLKRNGDFRRQRLYVKLPEDLEKMKTLLPDLPVCEFTYDGSLPPVRRYIPRLNWDVRNQ